MTPEDWTRVRELFDAALPLDPSERRVFLDEACAGRADLRSEIASLLAAHDGAGDFIEHPHYSTVEELPADSSDPVNGRTVGPYILRHEIGRGGMGVVYLAEDTRLSRRVALKAIAPGAGWSADRRERMRQEARAAAALSHPGIATVYALEEIDGELYLAFEYVPGATLRTLLESGTLPMAEVVDLSVQLARALDAAHTQGVVHRDLKPENIIRTPAGVVKVLDFGIARLETASNPRLTQAGTVVGTPGYMSPEQIRGDAVDFRSDLFALGVVMYEMAAGTSPFHTPGANPIAQVLERDPVPLHQACPTGSTALDDIVSRCLAKDPAGRYASTRLLVGDLERVQTALTKSDLPRTAGLSGEAEGVTAQTPASWWRFHQVAVSIVDALALYPAWRAHAWLAAPWDMTFFFAALASAAVGATVRLHLAFTARYYPAELAAQRRQTRSWTRIADAAFSASLALAALSIGSRHGEIAALLMAVAIATALAAFLIEPATARAAFGDAA